ncbi:MAG: hypothetical protein F4234_13785 [Gammaproteobacteria bacterium]|nr:hypothetical protein [Gammaproteobacteria bacterium]MYF01211.1 hypothetical protein [Gammaproteobacteria bacterium]MYG97755.1 hypothetical protein [Gammaproteobacteria bacterium]
MHEVFIVELEGEIIGAVTEVQEADTKDYARLCQQRLGTKRELKLKRLVLIDEQMVQLDEVLKSL